jgi:hypothetical protein
MSSWSDRRKLVALVVAIGALAIGATAWIYAGDLTYGDQSVIRADGEGYYVYLPAAFLDHDLTMRKTGARSFGGDPAYISGVNWVHNTRGHSVPLDQFGIGEAVLMAPFFFAGHLLAIAAGTRRDGFSWTYQAADDAAALVYVLLGLLLLGSVLRRWFRPGTVLVTVAAITFGAVVFEHATYDASFSHGYSFFLVALVLWLSLSVRDHPRVWSTAALGGAVGLAGLVRLTNLVVVIVPLLIGIERPAQLRTRVLAVGRRLDLLATGAGAFVLVLLPQLAYWHMITGRYLPNPYVGTGAHLHLLHPHLIGVLFSVRKGLFFWTPLVLLAVAGLPFLRRSAPTVFLSTLTYLVAITWVVASWSVWWYGGSFGMRALIDAMPMFALGLAALIDAARTVAARRALALAIGVTTLLAVHGMVAYWLKTIPVDRTTLHQYLASFWRY